MADLVYRDCLLTDNPWILILKEIHQDQQRKEEEEMPTYDYRCPNCKKKFTLILSIKEHDSAKVKCPKCGGKKPEQLITPFQAKTSRKS